MACQVHRGRAISAAHRFVRSDGSAHRWLVSAQELPIPYAIVRVAQGQKLCLPSRFSSNTTAYCSGMFRAINQRVGSLYDWYNIQVGHWRREAISGDRDFNNAGILLLVSLGLYSSTTKA